MRFKFQRLFVAIVSVHSFLGVSIRAFPLEDALKQAILLFQEGKGSESKEILERIIKQDSRNATAAYYLGRVTFNEAAYDKSIDWFEKAVKAESGNSIYHQWLGRAYGREAQNASIFRKPSLASKSKSSFEKAVTLDPDNVTARMDLMEFFRQAPGIAGGSMEKAIDQAKEIKKRSPYLGHLALGSIHEGNKDTVAAETEYQEALRNFPDSTATYYRLGILYANTRRYDKAFEIFEKLLRVKPDELSAHYQVGRTAAISGMRLDTGEKALRKYIENTPSEQNTWLAAAHWRLGMIHEHKKDTVLAKGEYETALKLDPNRKEAKEALKKLK